MGILDRFRGAKRSTPAREVESVQLGDTSVAEERAAEGSELKGWSVPLNPEVKGTATAESLVFDNGTKKVDAQLALSLSAVYACIDRISSNIALMPMQIKKKVGDELQDVKRHPAKFFIEKQPNDWQTPFTIIRQFMVDALNGNGYIWIKRNPVTGEIFSFEYCAEKSTELMNLNNGRFVYTHTDEFGVYHTIYPEDMIHLRALGNNGRKGLSVISLHANTILTGIDASKYGAEFFGNGAKPSGIVGVKNQLNNDGWDRLSNNWKKATREAKDNPNRVVFMPADLSYTPISISPLDARLIESMKMTRNEVAGIYNVPAWMIGDNEKTSFANITAMAIAFVRNTLQPWITNIEQEMNKKIFTREEIEKGLTVWFDMEVITRGTPAENLAIAAGASNSGLITRNEGRIILGYPRDNTDPRMNEFLVNVSQANFADEDKQGDKDKDNPEEDKENPENEETKETENE